MPSKTSFSRPDPNGNPSRVMVPTDAPPLTAVALNTDIVPEITDHLAWRAKAHPCDTDEPVTSPRETYSPITSALHLANQCLFNSHRCVHPSLYAEVSPFAPSDLVLYDAAYDSDFHTTTHHLVIHDINLSYVTSRYVAQHLEFYKAEPDEETFEEWNYHADEEQSWNMVEKYWHQDVISDWLFTATMRQCFMMIILRSISPFAQ
ncbi:hypothetical protein L198_05393 [Cryptococcus wingfieldii CBS 7118]|uniref:Uncharacterized protein n=1 Tax=Cryptococcus wingfieldii CBS 7118 TaxID=1295528 RepID=A0A1E3IYA0_9TREE|nr:hypothetical protein L198_05393 [Cryptococcus wingfieldii CBS 7118]ODN93528.1 hypothetical protein L198_05393 [Cryptococcus wingfieldii CBS 7118]